MNVQNDPVPQYTLKEVIKHSIFFAGGMFAVTLVIGITEQFFYNSSANTAFYILELLLLYALPLPAVVIFGYIASRRSFRHAVNVLTFAAPLYATLLLAWALMSSTIPYPGGLGGICNLAEGGFSETGPTLFCNIALNSLYTLIVMFGSLVVFFIAVCAQIVYMIRDVVRYRKAYGTLRGVVAHSPWSTIKLIAVLIILAILFPFIINI